MTTSSAERNPAEQALRREAEALLGETERR